jgi:cytochrome c oxidase assembly protein subunit 15
MKPSTEHRYAQSPTELAAHIRRDRLRRWTRTLALVGVLLCFSVIGFGAYVRLTAAGLGCPDWPGCYGHFTPPASAVTVAASAQRSPRDVMKAWREMIHRYAASTLGLVIVLILLLSLIYRRSGVIKPIYAGALLAVVILQGLLGMLTVTQLLKPAFVTLHLVFGMTTLGLLGWLWLSTRQELRASRQASANRVTSRRPKSNAVRHGYFLTLAGFLALVVQIALGGWTSSNYAAAACSDFPTCQGAWWPHADFENAFVFWRGLTISYEGGILDNAARMAIHWTHRIGALFATVLLGLAALFVILKSALSAARPYGFFTLGTLCLQLAIGVSMVLKGFPLGLAMAHDLGAAVLLLATLAQLRVLRSPTPSEARPQAFGARIRLIDTSVSRATAQLETTTIQTGAQS